MTKKIVAAARSLRKTSTDAEKVLWRHLRRKQLVGFKFRRQQPVDNFVVDFVCFEKRIIIEVDGGQHSAERDFERDSYLIKYGFKVLRFWSNDVLKNIEGVSEEIMKHC